MTVVNFVNLDYDTFICKVKLHKAKLNSYSGYSTSKLIFSLRMVKMASRYEGQLWIY